MIEWTNGKILELVNLVRGAGVLAAVVLMAYAYAKTRTLIAVLVAAITAGIFLWALNNTDWWQTKVEEESGAPAPVVYEVSAGELTPSALIVHSGLGGGVRGG